jgi:hypothetical protein
MKSPTPPAAPDPAATAAAQTQSNQQTAQYQAGLNMVNQVTPYGNLTYTGTNDGKPGSATATQTLSPIQQQLLDQSQQADLKQNSIGLEQLDKVQGLLNKPVDLSEGAAESRLYDLGSKRLAPQFKQQNQDLEQSLLNRGITVGSSAYNTLHNQQDQKENDAYNSLLLQGHQTAIGDMLQERNQPLNEINGLLNGQQIQNPAYVSTPQTNVAGTDVAGIYNSNYQNQLSAYNQQVQNQNATMGGLFGLGGTLGAAAIRFSDRRLKRDIVRVGSYRGHNLYAYRYIGKAERELGVMADELPASAVIQTGGFLAVDYSKL